MSSGYRRAPDAAAAGHQAYAGKRELCCSLPAANYDRNMKSWEENSTNSPKVPQVSIARSNGSGVYGGFGEKSSLARHLPSLSYGRQNSNEPSERSTGRSSLQWRAGD
ncbi:MAG: hypothetical protein WCK86_02290 [Planctomycetia bacterium]